ncbi:MAG: DUF4197 domain-containing protein, partial [Candidatus Nitrotoga sp.]
MMPRHMTQSVLFAVIALAVSNAHAFDFGGLLDKGLGNTGKPSPQNSGSATSGGAPVKTGAATPAANLASFSNNDQVASLKQALIQGAETAVANLSKENG